ncbi:MAG: glycyl-radical enzyme activating protein [Desulfomonilia bacterium]|nr:glycyl-radical enzyme activating protein [Desulfomonilia bacterium]
MGLATEESSQDKALIFEIKGNSLDDGPGIRTVVFFKGCPLSCFWCHNPESMNPRIELSYERKECIGCDSCIDVCDNGSLNRDDPSFINRTSCTLCMKCVDVCPGGALSQVGKYLPVEDVLEKIAADIPFFTTSGGGVTLSGGEPTLYMPYISNLMRQLRHMGVSTLIETCGLFNLETFMELCYPVCDLIYFDIKLLDAQEHKRLCGATNDVILKNFIQLSRTCAEEKKHLLPRVPLIPGITATEQNLTAIATFLRETGHEKVELLPYNPLWSEKLEKIGSRRALDDHAPMKTWMDRDALNRCRAMFTGFEII